jgi:hypothetical protein
MRVCGKRVEVVLLERVTFSPSANLIMRGASGTGSSSTGRPYFSLMTTLWPPIGLALPWRASPLVSPLATACQTFLLFGFRTSRMRTSAVIASVPSFVESMPR